LFSVRRKPQKRDERPAHQPCAGSLLFPEVVWTHSAWQQEARPHEFPRGPWHRRLLVNGGRRNGRASTNRNNRRAPPGKSDLVALKRQYEDAVSQFQRSEGRIIRAYWCATEASAVALTERKSWLGRLTWWRVGSIELHRVTEWVTEDAPQVAELLHSGDTLAIRINRVLTAVPRRIAMEWVFSEQSYLLGYVERTGGHPPRRSLRSTIARHRAEIDRLERYYDRAANKAARIRYFGGMLLGLAVVAGLGALIPFAVDAFGHIDLSSTSMRRFYACFVAGALGAIVSVMTRMRQADGVPLDYEVGELLIVLLGAFRPFLGTIFGVLAYAAIVSKFLPITPPGGGIQFFYYALFAFAAGFSERFAHVILGSADLTVAKATRSAEQPEQAPPTPAPPLSTTSRNGQEKLVSARSSRSPVGKETGSS
jgi:hypothetical protein